MHNALAIASVLALAVAAARLPPPEDRRAELFNLLRHDCGSCHGLTLKGGLGPSLLPADLEGRDPEDLRAVILDGLPGTPMPPWRGLLSEKDAAWIVEFLLKGTPE